MNLSWTAQTGNLFLSLGVKTLWKTKLWLIRAQSDASWSWSNCVWKSVTWQWFHSNFGVFCQSRIQLCSLQHSNPLKKNFTGAQHLHTQASVNKHSHLPRRGFFQGCAVKTLITANKSLSLSTATFVLRVIHVLLSGVFVVALFIQQHAMLIKSIIPTHKLIDYTQWLVQLIT